MQFVTLGLQVLRSMVIFQMHVAHVMAAAIYSIGWKIVHFAVSKSNHNVFVLDRTSTTTIIHFCKSDKEYQNKT